LDYLSFLNRWRLRIRRVLLDEFDAGSFEGLPHNNKRCISIARSRRWQSSDDVRVGGITAPTDISEKVVGRSRIADRDASTYDGFDRGL
jgi:hypothetical protein